MSSRSAERAKAVRKAWEREQSLITLGEGTRDWTPEQQQSIVEIGIAVDDEGKAFQGQHMKSVSMFPEYAGDPDNIQFLTRDEHLEAHNGNWQNPTNWYFDPVTKQKTFFNDELIPCAIIRLSDPIFVPSTQKGLTETNDNVQIQKNLSETGIKPDTKPNHLNNSDNEEIHTSTPTQNNVDSNVTTEKQKGEGILIRALKRYLASHSAAPEQIVSDLTVRIGPATVSVIIPTVFANRPSRISDNSHRKNTGNNTEATAENNIKTNTKSSSSQSSPTDISAPFSDNKEMESRSSPRAHDVCSHPQHYHTKDGVKLIYKDSYPRGGSKE